MLFSLRNSALIAVLLNGVALFASADESATGLGHCSFTHTEKYHLNDACNRASQNSFRDALNRHGHHRRLMPTGVRRVPNQKTVHCPENVEDLSRDDALLGFDTVWLLENTASTPVCVAWVKDGIEYSAMNSKITPPNMDPETIIQPGEWKSFITWESHIFHVRQMLEDGSMGPVLLQHRPGLIPIRNRYGPPITCDPNEPDPEPIVEETQERDPEFARTPPQVGRPCNTLDIGFRNQVGCPVHVYYTGMQGANTTTGEPTCMEDFKFHLGLNSRPNDFMWDWKSQTKYEGTYVGHNFVFRLAKDPSILLDEVLLQPTSVGDCPNLKQRDMIKTHMEVMPIGTLQHLLSNTTDTISSNATLISATPLQPALMMKLGNNSIAAAARSYYMSSMMSL